MTNIIIGISFIIIGAAFLVYVIKKPIKGILSYTNNRGVLAGFGLILIGIGFLTGKFHL